MAYTLMNIEEPDPGQQYYGGRSYGTLWLIVIFALLVAGFLRWGGYLLEASDALPEHVDAALVPQDPAATEKARIAAAMALLQQGSADRAAISIQKESEWGEEVAPVARQYIEKNYSAELAGRVDFCELDSALISIEQEAQTVSGCLHDRGWKTIALVTSNYDSRRAGMVWRRVLLQRDPSLQVSVDGVAAPEYRARGWWRQPIYAKTWLVEVTRLVRSLS